jgi:hypothetical protein
MQGGIEQQREIRAIVHHKERLGVPAEMCHALGGIENVAREEFFVPELQDARARFEDRFRCRDGVQPAVRKQTSVQNRVEAR